MRFNWPLGLIERINPLGDDWWRYQSDGTWTVANSFKGLDELKPIAFTESINYLCELTLFNNTDLIPE